MHYIIEPRALVNTRNKRVLLSICLWWVQNQPIATLLRNQPRRRFDRRGDAATSARFPAARGSIALARELTMREGPTDFGCRRQKEHLLLMHSSLHPKQRGAHPPHANEKGSSASILTGQIERARGRNLDKVQREYCHVETNPDEDVGISVEYKIEI